MRRTAAPTSAHAPLGAASIIRLTARVEDLEADIADLRDLVKRKEQQLAAATRRADEALAQSEQREVAPEEVIVPQPGPLMAIGTEDVDAVDLSSPLNADAATSANGRPEALRPLAEPRAYGGAVRSGLVVAACLRRRCSGAGASWHSDAGQVLQEGRNRCRLLWRCVAQHSRQARCRRHRRRCCCCCGPLSRHGV